MVDTSQDGYNREHAPLVSYAVLTLLSLGLVALAFWWGWRLGVLPSRVSILDMVLLGVATHKLSWLLSADAVTSYLRAPFTRYVKTVGPGASFREKPRGSGFRYAVGELLSCVWCMSMWSAAVLVVAFVFFPVVTRIAAVLLSVVFMSDVMHLLYIRIGDWALQE